MSTARITEILNYSLEHLTKFLTIIDSDHAYIHDGIGFSVVGTTAISGSGTYKLQFTTPDVEDIDVYNSGQRYIHWRPANIISTDGAFQWELFEGSTTISGGTSATVLNRNRTSDRTANMSVKVGVTVGTDGTRVQIAGSG